VDRFVIDNEIIRDMVTGQQVLHLEVDMPEHIVEALHEARDAALEEVAKGCDAYAIAYPGDERYARACRSCATLIRGRMSRASPK
jgi:hypothetical protein